jgi:hypothetical protein
VLRLVPFACMLSPIPPAGLMESIRSCYSIRFGLPSNRGGSAPALRFSRPAQRSLTLRPARSPSRLATLRTRDFSSLVASGAALIATGWSEPVAGRITPAVDQRLFTAHPIREFVDTNPAGEPIPASRHSSTKLKTDSRAINESLK